ncbi:hypothetical protein BMS3Abin04_02481 [bacterium BMS3Abin04]|nr:hypothetical protein BMS3Abin04_02481 [bacterium BMS3Abin04]
MPALIMISVFSYGSFWNFFFPNFSLSSIAFRKRFFKSVIADSASSSFNFSLAKIKGEYSPGLCIVLQIEIKFVNRIIFL